MKFGIFELSAAVIVIVVLFAAAPAAEGPPIIGPAPLLLSPIIRRDNHEHQ